MTQTETAVWTKITSKMYVTDCKRFAIHNISMTTRPKWVLFDFFRKDVCNSQYTWSITCSTLSSAKSKAERILSGWKV